MKQLNTSECRSLAKSVELPEHVRTSILREAAQLHNECPSPATPAPARSEHHPFARRIAMATCALALVVGVAAAGGVLADRGYFLGVGTESDNSFALAAYAAESSGETGQSVALKRDFGTMSGFQWSDNDDMESAFLGEDRPTASADSADSGVGFAGVSLFLNLSCVGKNVDTLTYSIEGDSTYFYQENRNWGPPPFNIGPPSEPKTQKSFSVAYDEQASDKAVVQRQLYLFFALDEQARKAYERDGAGPPWRGEARPDPQDLQDAEYWNKQLTVETMRMFAEKIVEHPITLTATFKDGSTQAKSYLIVPTSDFAEQLEAFRVSDEVGFSDLSPYFTLTEVVER